MASATPPVSLPVPRVPLLPVAVALTLGIVADRLAEPPRLTLVGLAVGCFAAWFWAWCWQRPSSIVWLWSLILVLGALWHQLAHLPSAEDICSYAPAEGKVVRLRGTVLTMPAVSKLPSPSLRTVPQAHRSSFLLEVTQLDLGPWQPCSGKLKVWVEERLDQVRLGDEIEIVGLLLPWTLPGNPGEHSLAEVGTDQGVFAGLIVKTADGIVVRATGSPWKKETWLNQLHASATATLQRHLPPELTGVGQALVLGDEAALEQPQMESYMRTGVFHVLAVSGQHLTVLCLFLQPVLTLFRLRRRPRAVVLILLVIGYALLTGNRPPMMRAAVMVCTACGGLLLLRKPQPLNSLLLAWVLLAVGNPGDLFGVGCQLSFLAVLILVQCWGPWRAKAEVELPPLDRLERDLAPPWRKCLRWVGNWLYWSWAASLVIWLLSLPLLACRFHLVSPVAVLLGPFLVLLASIALVAGFLLVLAGMIHETLAWLPAWVMKTALLLAQGLIDFCQQIPGAYWYCADLPAWWVAGFYLHVLLVLVWPQLGRWWRWHLLVGGCWFLVLYLPPRSAPVAEVRCTILSVGHGSCAVIETPQGQVFLYDTGSMSGPEAATRSIAPFLWSRGYTQIDEVFLSHADLDHFNGLPALMQRFRIAQISLTPTFREKPIRGVQTVLAEWEQRHIPVRVLTAPQTLHAGTLEIQVLHPPAQGPTGNENARSMVLRLGYQGQTLLLTGDLEGEGLRQVMGLSLSPPDVLVAPHHGSPASNTPTFAQWAAAKLVISSEGNPHYFRPDPYSERGAVLWRTWKEGAVTVRLSRQGIVAETYRTKQRWEKTVLATPR